MYVDQQYSFKHTFSFHPMIGETYNITANFADIFLLLF